MRFRCLLALALSCWMMGSCASAEPPASDASSVGSSRRESVEGDSPAETRPRDLAEVDSPFDYESPVVAFLGIESGYSIEAHIEFEEALALCMAEEGFEYWPQPVPYESFGLPTDADGPLFGTEEWVNIFGFGLSTQAFSQAEVGPELIGYEFTSQGSNNDPNSTYRESLSDEERQAYDLILYGHPHDLEQDAEGDAISRSESCTSKARVGSAGGVDTSSFNDEFDDELAAMYDRIRTHPRIEAARSEAAECLSLMGSEYVRYDEVKLYIDSGLQDVLAAPGSVGSANPGEGSLSEEARALLAKIQAEEVSLAQAFRQCGAPNETYDGIGDPLFKEVRIELEEEFLRDNRERLEAFLLSQAQ